MKEHVVIDLLNNDLIVGLNNQKQVDFWLAVPEIIDWSDFNGFKYSTRKKDDLIEDLQIQDYLDTVARPVTLEDLEEDVISCWKESKNNYSHTWSVFRCLNAEVLLNKELYFLDKAKWYKIDNSFVREVNKEIKAVKFYSKPLPDFSHADENDYNVFCQRS